MADGASHVVRRHAEKLSLELVEAFEFDVCLGRLNRPFGDQFVQDLIAVFQFLQRIDFAIANQGVGNGNTAVRDFSVRGFLAENQYQAGCLS